MTPKRYDDDDIESALFALDLEEPPAELRNTILAQTIRHVPVSASVRPWELWVYGALCAAMVWLFIAAGRGAGQAAMSYGGQLLSYFSQPQILIWVAAGAAVVWIFQMNLTFAPGYQRAARR
jgi:hypothetical protein